MLKLFELDPPTPSEILTAIGYVPLSIRVGRPKNVLDSALNLNQVGKGVPPTVVAERVSLLFS